MPLAYIAPAASVSCLLLSAGLATALVAVEAKPAASASANKPELTMPAPAGSHQEPLTADEAQSVAWLGKHLTITYNAGASLATVVEDIGRQAGGTVVFDPQLPKAALLVPIGMDHVQTSAGDGLFWAIGLAECQIQVVNGVCLILAKNQPVPDIVGRCSLAGLGPERLTRLDKSVSVEINGKAVDAVMQVGHLLGQEVVVDPRVTATGSPRKVTVTARNLRGRDLIALVCYLGCLQARVVEGRLKFEPVATYSSF
jgi:hypothetical protein